MIDEKVLKKLPPGFAQQLPKLVETDLKKIIQESARTIKDLNKEMKHHREIIALKDQIKDLEGPYKDAIGIFDAKIIACHETLNGRGVVIDLNEGRAPEKKAG